jgi:hypothetical protein
MVSAFWNIFSSAISEWCNLFMFRHWFLPFYLCLDQVENLEVEAPRISGTCFVTSGSKMFVLETCICFVGVQKAGEGCGEEHQIL